MTEVRGKELVIDGYNVIITIETALFGKPLILADDGFLRDISGISKNYNKNYKRSEKTDEALRLIFDLLKKVKPNHTLFLLDSPISHSGQLAKDVREYFKKENIFGSQWRWKRW